jgi:hypothetical protein
MKYSDFFSTYRKYLLGDLTAMINKADSKCFFKRIFGYETNYISVPIANSIFSFLDIFGFLIRNNIFLESNGTNNSGKIDTEINNTSVNISYSLITGEEYFKLNQLCPDYQQLKANSRLTKNSNEYNVYIKSTLHKFIKSFRHSMAHSFLHESFYITNLKSSMNQEIFYCDKDQKLIFNVRKFYNSFKLFFNSIESDPNHYNINTVDFEKNLRYYLNKNLIDSAVLDPALKSIYCSIHNNTTTTQTTAALNQHNIFKNSEYGLHKTGSLDNN